MASVNLNPTEKPPLPPMSTGQAAVNQCQHTGDVCHINIDESAHGLRRGNARWICLAYTVVASLTRSRSAIHTCVQYIHWHTRPVCRPTEGKRLLFNARAVGRVPVLSRVDPWQKEGKRGRGRKRERDRWIPSETGGSPTGGKHGTRVANDQTCFLWRAICHAWLRS